jgi:hypothetical protein
MEIILIAMLMGAGIFIVNLFKKNSMVIKELESTRRDLEKFKPIQDIQAEIARLNTKRTTLLQELDEQLKPKESLLAKLTEEIADLECEIYANDTGFYQPKFKFEAVVQYAEALDIIREAQKEIMRQKKAVVEMPSSSEHSKIQLASKLVSGKFKDITKLAIAAFNSESTTIIESVRFDNFEKCKGQIQTHFNKINSLIEATGFQVADKYLELKIKELALVYDYQEAEQKSKTEQSELKAAMREEEDARSEAEEARAKAVKEQERYEAALEQARQEMASKSDEERAKYEAQILEIQRKLDEATAERERATSMAQITKRGHVYIISNIGSFGENVFKIGMTRRKDPTDRIKELGDASVPFGFDIHAIIETEDAPALENALHAHFDSRRRNKVNLRKEFFDVELDEIVQACKDIGLNVRLTRVAEAREYRESLNLKNTSQAA